MSEAEKEQLRGRPAKERLELAIFLWDSLAEDADLIQVSEEEMAEVRRRIAAYENGEDPGVAWDELKKQLLDE